MFATLLNFSLLALALPAALAYHGNPIMNRYYPHGVAKRAEGYVQLFKRFDNARWSFYNAETGNAGSCGRMLSNSGFTVAMNVAQMNSGLCYQTITMSYNGKSTTATIVDTCPGCPYGGLDLTPGLFSFFASQSAGIIYGTWNFGNGAAAPVTPKPTTTWHPAPTPTTTWKPATTSTSTPAPKPTTTSTSSKPSSSSHPSSSASSSASSSSSVSYSSNGLATPTGTISVTPGQPDNLSSLIQAFVQMGGIAMAGSKL